MADGRSAANNINDESSSSKKEMDENAETCNSSKNVIGNNKLGKGHQDKTNNEHQQQQQNGHHHHGSGHSGKAISATGEKKPIRLNSPAGCPAVTWHWSEKEKILIGAEVLDIIRYLVAIFKTRK